MLGGGGFKRDACSFLLSQTSWIVIGRSYHILCYIIVRWKGMERYNMSLRSVTDHRLAYGLPSLAKSLEVSIGFLRSEIRKGHLRSTKLGRRTLVLSRDVAAYLGNAQ